MEKIKILIVEDDKFFRDLVAQKLEREGFEVGGVGSGKESEPYIKEHKPALIILDLVLPGEDGFTILKNLKNDPATKDIPVIILSNLGQKEEVEKGMSLGAEEFMIKVNFTPDEIVEKIRKTLQTKYV